jgi:aminoglycoside phosphotransferase (APT) family kinase protein
VRGGAGEVVGLDVDALERFVVRALPQFPPPLECRLLAGGRSNLTYLVTAADGGRFVVRRPPMGDVAPSANDVAREHRVLSALAGSAVPVPTTLALVTDAEVIGAPLMAMAFVDGDSIDTAAAGARLGVEQAGRASEALVDALVAIHSVELDEVGLADLARHGGYLERQVRRWRQQWDHVRTRDLPTLDVLHKRLLDALPDGESGLALVHGDFRFDNTRHAHGDPAEVVAVLDWEMSTLGDPLADLALLMGYWDGVAGALLPGGDPVAANPGFPSAEELGDMYAARSGADLAHLAFYRALASLKLAVIAEGLYQRHLAGASVGDGFDAIGVAVPDLVAAGLEHLDGAVGPARPSGATTTTREEPRAG